jgi:hypothetical protein
MRGGFAEFDHRLHAVAFRLRGIADVIEDAQSTLRPCPCRRGHRHGGGNRSHGLHPGRLGCPRRGCGRRSRRRCGRRGGESHPVEVEPEGIARTDVARWSGPTKYDRHAVKSMAKRGWTEAEVDDLVAIQRVSPESVTRTGVLVASGSMSWRLHTSTHRGNYVVRNDTNGHLVQVSRKNDPEWKAPFDGP